MAAEPAPIDQAGGTSHEEPGGERSSTRTPTVLWAAVSLMCLGVVTVGFGVVLLGQHRPVALWCFGAGIVLGLIGGALSLRNGIMSNVE